MKRVIALIVCILMMASLASADSLVTPSDDTLSRDRAIASASEEARRLLSLSAQSLESLEISANLVYVDESESEDWFITFFGDGYPEPATTVVIDSLTGKIKTSHTKDFYTYMTEDLESTWGNHTFWTLEEQALFDQIYIAPSSSGRKILPGEGFLPEEEAVRIGKRAIMEKYGVTEKTLESLRMHLGLSAFIPDPALAPTPENCQWTLSYRPHEPDHEGYYANTFQVNVSALDGEVLLLIAYDDGD